MVVIYSVGNSETILEVFYNGANEIHRYSWKQEVSLWRGRQTNMEQWKTNKNPIGMDSIWRDQCELKNSKICVCVYM